RRGRRRARGGGSPRAPASTSGAWPRGGPVRSCGLLGVVDRGRPVAVGVEVDEEVAPGGLRGVRLVLRGLGRLDLKEDVVDRVVLGAGAPQDVVGGRGRAVGRPEPLVGLVGRQAAPLLPRFFGLTRRRASWGLW